MTDDVRRFQPQRLYQVGVVQRQIEQVFDMVNARVALESGMERSIDRETLGQRLQERGPALVSERAVQVEERLTLASLHVLGGYRPDLDRHLFGNSAHLLFS